MKKQKDDEYFISRIIDDIDYIMSILDGIEFDAFSNNQMMSDSTVFRLIQISENSRGISEEARNSVEFDWYKVSGMRNRLVHDYGNVDYRVVYKTARNDLPQLRFIMEQLKDEKNKE
jgi:uncharacterized protein with HEPN domain